MKKLTITFIYLLLQCTAVLADNGQTVTIDGSVVGKCASSLSFDGKNVTITFEDGTTQTADMAKVSISLTYDNDASGITSVTVAEKKDAKVYTFSGLCISSSPENLSKGIYIVNGKKVVIK